MSDELCTSMADHISTSLIISHIIIPFSSSILSHPLYFSYFVFFSPYLLKLVSFLSPLFVTTLLIFLANNSQSPHKSWASHLLSVVEQLRSENDRGDEEFHCCFDDFEGVYEIFFGSENDDRSGSDGGGGGLVVEENRISVGEFEIGGENRVCVGELENNNCGEIMVEEKRLENFLKILDEFEKMSSKVEQVKKKVAPLSCAKIDKVVEKPNSAAKTGSNDDKLTFINGEKQSNSMVKSQSQRIRSEEIGEDDRCSRNFDCAKIGSNADKLSFINGEKQSNSIVKSQSQRIRSEEIGGNDGSSRDFDCNFNSYGSMRKEKEWNRTLACKLFEERHNVDGGEGMDSLWEAYELDSSKSKAKSIDKKKNKSKKKSEVEEEEEEEDEIVGQLCCLQALKLSAGKMNMGMKRPNLVKITKAIKGFGWLHHVSKKVHNNGDKDRYC